MKGNIIKADPARQPRHIVDLYLGMIGEDKNNWPEHISITNNGKNVIDKVKIKDKISQIKTKLLKINERSILNMQWVSQQIILFIFYHYLCYYL